MARSLAARAPSRLASGDAAVAATGAAILLLLLTFVAWPVLRVLALSLSDAGGVTLGHYQSFFGTWRLLRILLNSLLVSLTSTVITVAVALVLAYAVTRTTVPGKRFLSLMSLIPLIAPPFLVSLAFILLLGRNGVVTRALGLDWSIYGFHGIVIAQVFTFLPQAYILLANVLGNMDVALEEAAENLGAGPLTTLRRVTLALARPGLASAALVVFILCMTDFGNPILIGGRYNVLATEIYAQVIGMNDFAAAATMSVVLIVPCLLAYLVNAYVVGARSYVAVTAGGRSAPRLTPPAVRWPLAILAGGIALVIAAIYALIPLGSVVRLWGSDWTLSLAHYAFASTAEGAWPVWNSVKLAVAAGGAGTVLAIAAAYVVERTRLPGRSSIEFLSLLPAALPGTVIGVGYIIAFNVPPLLLTGTLWILVASVVFWKLPVAVLAAMNALKQMDPASEEAAVSLGAGRGRTFFTVVLPPLTGTAFSIFIYFFINGMVTVSAVVFLIYPGFNLGSVAILAQVENGYPGVACALGTIILAIVIGAVLLLRAVMGHKETSMRRILFIVLALALLVGAAPSTAPAAEDKLVIYTAYEENELKTFWEQFMACRVVSAADGTVEWQGRRLRAVLDGFADGAEVLVSVRPEKLAIVTDGAADGRNRLHGTVDVPTFLGPVVRLEVGVDGQPFWIDIPQAQAALVDRKTRVTLAWSPADAVVIAAGHGGAYA
ncbi:MAG: ABC transporter permease subunit [Candidatus Rokuibacteriota bacterium]